MIQSGSHGDAAETEQGRADFQVGRERVGRADLLPQGGGAMTLNTRTGWCCDVRFFRRDDIQRVGSGLTEPKDGSCATNY